MSKENQELRDLLEELSSYRDLNTKYGAAVLQAAVILEIRKLREAIEKSNSIGLSPP